jgi:hypothetical protein
LKIYNQLVHPKNHVWVSSNSWIYWVCHLGVL